MPVLLYNIAFRLFHIAFCDRAMFHLSNRPAIVILNFTPLNITIAGLLGTILSLCRK